MSHLEVVHCQVCPTAKSRGAKKAEKSSIQEASIHSKLLMILMFKYSGEVLLSIQVGAEV